MLYFDRIEVSDGTDVNKQTNEKRAMQKIKNEVDTEKVLVSNKISFGERPLNTLLVTCIMIIRLNHYL